MSDELAFSASYTLSKTFDDASDFDEQPQNPFDLRVENAVSRQHQQQRFVFQRTVGVGPSVTKRIRAGSQQETLAGSQTPSVILKWPPILTLESGRPVNPLTDLIRIRVTPFPSRQDR